LTTIIGINDGRRPRVQAYLSVRSLDVHRMIWFLIDTGSTESAISESEASLAKIDVATSPYVERGAWGFGGSFRYKVINRPVELIFRSTNGGYYTVPQSGFKVIPAEHANPDVRRRMLELTPSILGMDVLSKFQIQISRRKVELIPYDDKS